MTERLALLELTMNLERDGAEHWRHLCSRRSRSHPYTVSVLRTFAYLRLTLSKGSRQALILPIDTLLGTRVPWLPVSTSSAKKWRRIHSQNACLFNTLKAPSKSRC